MPMVPTGPNRRPADDVVRKDCESHAMEQTTHFRLAAIGRVWAMAFGQKAAAAGANPTAADQPSEMPHQAAGASGSMRLAATRRAACRGRFLHFQRTGQSTEMDRHQRCGFLSTPGPSIRSTPTARALTPFRLEGARCNSGPSGWRPEVRPLASVPDAVFAPSRMNPRTRIAGTPSCGASE